MTSHPLQGIIGRAIPDGVVYRKGAKSVDIVKGILGWWLTEDNNPDAMVFYATRRDAVGRIEAILTKAH